ncbi:MAG TPA: hypothetical protein VJ884_00495, partial [Salinibacter sp.]|nr:hypothetical protein [Salinibacter sp.]
NLAHVVAHAGLNQEAHWQYFKEETAEAQVLADLDAWAQAHDEGETSTGEEAQSGNAGDSDPAEVTNETIEGFDVDAYLPVEGKEAEEAKEHLQDVENALDALKEKGLDVPDADDVKREIAALNQPLGDEELPPPPNRPARERHAYRKILDHAVRRAAGTILRRLDIPEGTDLVDAVGKGEEESNVEVVLRMLNRRVNAAVGHDDDTEGRNEWPLTTLKAAKEQVSAVRDAVLADIADTTAYSAADTPNDPPTEGDEEETGSEWSDLDDFEWGDPF